MAILKSKIKINSSGFKTNSVEMGKQIDVLKDLLKKSRIEGTDASIKKARERKKFLARERIELLIDRDSPFLELSPLAGLNHDSGFGVGGTNVCGIGFVEKNVGSAWSNLEASKSFLNSVRSQVRAAKIANEGIAAEYERGSRTTLDVIQSNSLLLAAKISLAESERNNLIAQYNVLKAIGLLNSEYLKLK